MGELQKALHPVFSDFDHLPENFVHSLGNYIHLRFANHKLETGEPYQHYAQSICSTLSILHLDYETILSALLWNLYSFRNDAHKEITRYFSKEVADLTQRVTKILNLDYKIGKDVQTEQLRHLILSMAQDIRVVFILLVHKNHTLHQANLYAPSNPSKDALEAKDVFAPLANRLGIGRLKSELEDASFQIVEPEIYYDIKKRSDTLTSNISQFLEDAIKTIRSQIIKENIRAEIKSRIKHLYSIYKKMKRQRIPFDQVYDVAGVRIITQSIKDCYTIVGIIHSLWKPIPNRFKDYIALPKQNMYQSIHTSVIGPNASPFEIQIRTEEMDRIAEIGIAAHWRYKDGHLNQKYDEKFAWLRQIMEWQQDRKDASELMEILKVDLFPDDVYVFTPDGDVKCLPKGSTVIDFAYSVHSEIGHHCKRSWVNNRMVPIRTRLNTGDIVKIQTSPNSTPSIDWLEFVKTASAKNKIKRFLKEQTREKLIETGTKALEKLLKRNRFSVKSILETKHINQIASNFGFQNSAEMFTSIGTGKFEPRLILKRMRSDTIKEENKNKQTTIIDYSKTNKIKVADLKDISVRFARCCEPLPGEEIVGFITAGRGLTIHAKRCANIKNLPNDRVVKAEWESSDRPAYPVKIVFTAHHTQTIHLDVSKLFVKHDVRIISHYLKTARNFKIRGEYIVDITNIELLERVISDLLKISGMIKVHRTMVR